VRLIGFGNEKKTKIQKLIIRVQAILRKAKMIKVLGSQRLFYRSWSFLGSCLLAFILLISFGIAYRVLAERLELFTDVKIALERPLNEFPMEFGGWQGSEVEISKTVQKVAGNDDFLSRLYMNSETNQWANVYVAYSARPRTMRGHRPQVCYPSGGWVHDGTVHDKVISASGRDIKCLIHRFRRPAPSSDEIVVLNFYILNGEVTDDEDKFAGVGFRTPNISGDAARYVTQVQISSVMENSVRSAAAEMTDLILSFFPETGIDQE
jgi:hypothetical protein